MINVLRTLTFVFLALVWCVPISSSGHPAHAKPVNYPFVVGFERFYTDLDTPEHLAKGGLVLLNELNCVACHQPPQHLKETLTGRTGTRLDGVADRFSSLDLELMIRNPRFIKTDTTMPSMFSGRDRNEADIEAITHFLSTLKEPLTKYAEGDIENGKQLYHKIGCITCHAPELDYRPPWIPKGVEIYLTGLPSVPMNLADRYPRDALIDLLIDPTKHRPAGRMPKFDLTKKEAIDIGSYLNATPKPELSTQLQEALAKLHTFELDSNKVEQGKKLFEKKNCMACHAGVVNAKTKLSIPLSELKWDEPVGCLSDRPLGGAIPSYGIEELQKKAIKEALKQLSETRKETPEQKADWILASRNCYACHDRAGKGGTEEVRKVYFTVNNPDALANGRWASHPPSLNGVGAKLTDEWWKRTLYHQGGSGSVRNFMALRMPIYRPEDLGNLENHIKQIDHQDFETTLDGDPQRGHSLVCYDSKNCVACHGLGKLPPPGIPSINLNQTTKRLRPEFFTSLLKYPESVHPEIPMPNLGVSQEEAADIWAYLSEIQNHPLPDGLLKPEITEHIPDGRPIVIRTALEGITSDGLAIGFPGGTNFAFDIQNSRLVRKWRGRFLDQQSVLGTIDETFLPIEINTPYTGYQINQSDVTLIGKASKLTIHLNGRTEVKLQ